MVFMKDDQVIQYVEMDRQGNDFTLREKVYLTPTDDIIIIERFLVVSFIYSSINERLS